MAARGLGIRIRPRPGLTLAEVVVTIGVLAVAALGLLTLFVSGLRSTAHSVEAVGAVHAAQQFLQAVKEFDKSLIPSSSTFDGFADTADSNGFPPLPYPRFQVDGNEFTLKVKTRPVEGRVVSVQVEVYWTEKDFRFLELYVRK